MSNEENMEDYNAKADNLCNRIQNQIQEGDTLDVVMEVISFIAASAGVQMIEKDTAIPDKETFIQHLVMAVLGQMEDLEQQEQDKLTRSNYVQ